ncbi:MAG: type ISP restriction/modification enzyme [Acidobacteriota bacterium]|nr:type ISP restriction/modification enzyme [Acidobacteriota bacterium]
MSIAKYCQQIEKALQAGNATEHTHRPALKTLVESLAKDLTATNEPKRVKCGAPDYIITRGEIPVGYIEAKDVGKSLDEIEEDEQLRRYRDSLANLILTDYLEFRWYVGGEHRLTARLAKADRKGKLTAEKDGAEQVTALLESFFAADPPTIINAKDLATRMASLARLTRSAIRLALDDEDKNGELHQQLKSFQRSLVNTLTEDQFADMYAQTICYGLFAARYHAKGGERFTRRSAAWYLPKTNPFLQKMFSHIAGVELDDRVAWAVDDLAELLHRADINAVLENFGNRTRREDPVVHFYETFLSAYDPKMREMRGVYYTPEPVVSYIVRSVDHILKTDFGLSDGLADASKIEVPTPGGKGKIESHKVLILDPATGTGTFLHGVIDHIFEKFQTNRGMWSGYVKEHLLPRIFGFELLMAPYAVAHLKLGLQLSELGYDFKADERLRVYLTNALEKAPQLRPDDSAFTHWLFEEATGATKAKQETPVMVVLGNPPYSGHSANTGQWIADLLRGSDTITGQKTGNYFAVDGQPLGERNPKWLNDDYVKFIRFAQWRIEQTGYGVLAFITNHGYLDNPTFRGMRQSLMETFDDIYVLDLHGNSKKKEKAPDGSKDENIFDIQQGVAIGIFVKRENGKKKLATVRHAHLWGARGKLTENNGGERQLTDGKYRWLGRNYVKTTKWTKLKPEPSRYLFVPQDAKLKQEYEQGFSLAEMMPVNSVGLVTSRDGFVFDFDENVLRMRIKNFVEKSLTDEEIKSKYLSDTDKLQLSSSRRLLREDKGSESAFVRCLYRPFDVRHLFYHDVVLERSRREAMRHLLTGENLGLISARSNKSQSPDHFFCSRLITEAKCGEATTQSAIFPLYLYPNGELPPTLFDHDNGRRPNFTDKFVADFSTKLRLTFIPDGKGNLKKTFGPEDVFAYLYAIFHSPTYRVRYAEFLKMDFPRLPLTGNVELFRALCRLGEELVGLHLMEKQSKPITTYPQPGDNTIETIRYDEAERRIYINKTQYFLGVPPEVWAFHVGGYQVCQKWLKDRKSRQLTYDDLTHYQGVVAALARTIELMSEVDETINENGGWPLA